MKISDRLGMKVRVGLVIWATMGFPLRAGAAPASKLPCNNLANACQAAGYTKLHKKGKGLWIDCLLPILGGKSVAGLNPNPLDVQGCRAKTKKK